MKPLITAIWAQYILCKTKKNYLNGDQYVTYHEYGLLDEVQKVEYPPSCECNFTFYNVSLITAVRGLERKECFSCLNVSSPITGRSLFVLGVDIGGLDLDLSKDAFKYIHLGEGLGKAHSVWNNVSKSYCEHIWQKNPTSSDNKNCRDLASPSTIPEAEPVTIPEAGPVTIPEAGPSTIPEAGPSTIPEAGPVTVPEASKKK